MISIICPTIDGREEYLANCKAKYAANTEERFEFIVVQNKPTCGIAWQEGAERLRDGLWVHFTADDLEPVKGWDTAAIRAVMSGYIPGARIEDPQGGLHRGHDAEGVEIDYSTVPFMSRYQWSKIGPMIPLHHYTDNWFSYRARKFGWPTLMVHSYCFIHYAAEEGNIRHKQEQERTEYEQLIAQEL